MDFFRSNNSIFDKQNITGDYQTLYFTLDGSQETYFDNIPLRNQDDNLVYAKKYRKIDGSYKYMIKLANNGKLYNPISIYGEEKTNTFLDSVCKSSTKFKTVNEKAFNFYIQFLTSKNIAYYHNAEREVD